MKVYGIDVSKIDGENDKWDGYLSKYRKDKVKRLKRPEKKAQSIGAELVLNYAVGKEIGKKPEYDIDENGKPYLTNADDVYFNLSHSGDYAVCVVHDSSVGIDIQKMKEFDAAMIKRFFTDEEKEYIEKSKDMKKAFFEIWSKKESFIKAVGKGLRIPLNSFSVCGDIVEYEDNTYRFKKYTVSKPGYVVYVCYAVK